MVVPTSFSDLKRLTPSLFTRDETLVIDVIDNGTSASRPPFPLPLQSLSLPAQLPQPQITKRSSSRQAIAKGCRLSAASFRFYFSFC